MSVAGQPPGTEVLPHKKTYDNYVRIVEPGRHVFRTRMSVERCVYSLLGFGAAVTLMRIGFFQLHALALGHALGVFAAALACLSWSGAIAIVAGTTWHVRRSTVVEITPRQITLKRRRLVRWRKSEWPISAFVEAIAETGPVFSYGGRSVQYSPRLAFFDNPALAYADKASWMSELFYSKEDADELVHDINASVERARRAPEAF